MTQASANTRLLFAGLFALLVPMAAPANDKQSDPVLLESVGFVAIRSTTDYAEAHRVAAEASRKIGIRLDLRGVIYDEEHGLTLSKEECAEDPFYPYPCYVARGRLDAGTYVSIERSDAYGTFDPGCFLVIAASGKPGSDELVSAHSSVVAAYPDAFMKVEEVYVGCMH